MFTGSSCRLEPRDGDFSDEISCRRRAGGRLPCDLAALRRRPVLAARRRRWTSRAIRPSLAPTGTFAATWAMASNQPTGDGHTRRPACSRPSATAPIGDANYAGPRHPRQPTTTTQCSSARFRLRASAIASTTTSASKPTGTSPTGRDSARSRPSPARKSPRRLQLLHPTTSTTTGGVTTSTSQRAVPFGYAYDFTKCNGYLNVSQYNNTALVRATSTSATGGCSRPISAPASASTSTTITGSLDFNRRTPARPTPAPHGQRHRAGDLGGRRPASIDGPSDLLHPAADANPPRRAPADRPGELGSHHQLDQIHLRRLGWRPASASRSASRRRSTSAIAIYHRSI